MSALAAQTRKVPARVGAEPIRGTTVAGASSGA
jgi:hypothetical protein